METRPNNKSTSYVIVKFFKGGYRMEMKIWSEQNHRSFLFRKFFQKCNKNIFPLGLLHKHLKKYIIYLIRSLAIHSALSLLSGVGFQYIYIFIKLISFYFVKNYHNYISFASITHSDTRYENWNHWIIKYFPQIKAT